jgi:hypothetical protein
MTANEWVGIAVGVTAVSTSLLLGLRWVIKSYLQELKPNSGSSIKDQITRLEQRVDDGFANLLNHYQRSISITQHYTNATKQLEKQDSHLSTLFG